MTNGNGKYKIDTEKRLVTLETHYEGLRDVVYEIKDNHLVHLANDLKQVKDKVDTIGLTIAKWTGGVGVVLWLAGKLIERYL